MTVAGELYRKMKHEQRRETNSRHFRNRSDMLLNSHAEPSLLLTLASSTALSINLGDG
jgi:hypothetical protein